MLFTARRSYASEILGVVILSVCLSARLSVTRVLCDKTKRCTADILYHMKRQSVFWHQQWLVRDVPFCLKFALKVTHPLRKTPVVSWRLYRVWSGSIVSLKGEVPQKPKQVADIVYRFWLQKRQKFENVAQFTLWFLNLDKYVSC